MTAIEIPPEPAAAALKRQVKRLQYRVRHPLRFRRITSQCERRRCIFVHIPKCAGTSIRQTLFGTPGGHRTLAGYRMLLGPRKFEEYFKFTFVRNPWDRLASAFFFLKNEKLKSNQKWAKQNLSEFSDFETFVRQWVTRENVWSYSHFRPQFQFICLDNRTPGVDFIGFYENLAADFRFVCEKLNIDVVLSEENRNARRKRDYRECYTEETRRIVERVYAEDIRLLGYSFDNSSLPDQITARDANARTRRQSLENHRT